MAVQHDVATVAKADRPFPVLWLQIISWPPDLRVSGDDLDAGANCFHGLSGCICILAGQKTIGTLDIK